MSVPSRIVISLCLLIATAAQGQQTDIKNKTIVMNDGAATSYVYIATSGNIFTVFRSPKLPTSKAHTGAQFKLGEISEYTIKDGPLTCTFRVSASLSDNVLTLKNISSHCFDKTVHTKPFLKQDQEIKEIVLSGETCRASQTSQKWTSCRVVEGNKIPR